MTKWHRYLLIISMVLQAFIIPHNPPAADCTPTPDYRFLEEYQLEQVVPPLPEDLHIEVSPLSTRGSLQISNQGEHPAYLISRTSYPHIVRVTTPAGAIAGLAEDDLSGVTLLLGDRVPEYASAVIEDSQTFTLDIGSIPRLVDERFEDHNVLTPSRSSFIVLPPAQRTEFYLVYAEQLYEVTFGIVYRLNAGFQGRTCENAVELSVESPNQPEADGGFSIGPSTTIFISISILFIILVYWLNHKRATR